MSDNVTGKTIAETATKAIEDFCIHENPVSEGCDCPRQGQAAVVAVLKVLQKEMMACEDWACDFGEYRISGYLEELECE